jgi:hypothetical protein
VSTLVFQFKTLETSDMDLGCLKLRARSLIHRIGLTRGAGLRNCQAASKGLLTVPEFLLSWKGRLPAGEAD